MNKIIGTGVCCLLALAAAGCFGFERKSTVTAPTATGISALLGNWSSSGIIPASNSCSDFKWSVTEQTTNTAGGTFSATCANDVKLSGTAQGALSGSVINWTADGTATAAGLGVLPVFPDGHGRARRRLHSRAVLRRHLRGPRQRSGNPPQTVERATDAYARASAVCAL
jgi:hypothetical protein